MDRRIVMAALAAGIATPALAQTANDMTRQGSSRQQTGMSKAEQDHLLKTEMHGSASLATSRMGLKKAQNEKVKAFAELEVAEQETVAEVIKTMMMPAAFEPKMKPPTETEVKKKIGDTEQETVKKLESANGAEFDKMYVVAQIDVHKKLLADQESYLESANDPNHANVAKLARGHIKEHLAILNTIQKEVA